MDELQFGSEVDIGFVEGDEEEGEDLLDVDEENLGLLVVFCMRMCQLVID